MKSRFSSANFRILMLAFFVGLFGLNCAGNIQAQKQNLKIRLKVQDIRLGFNRPKTIGTTGGYKTGMWTPVYVTLAPDPDGRLEFPVKNNSVEGKLFLTTNDSDDVEATYVRTFTLDNPTNPSTIIAYTKPGSFSPRLDLTFEVGNDKDGTKKTFSVPDNYIDQSAMNINGQLYLTLGGQSTDLENEAKEMKGTQIVSNETTADQLPDRWFAYQAVDLMVLFADSNFMTASLTNLAPRGRDKAVCEWVRRGGRLLIVVSGGESKDQVHKFLKSEHWHANLEKHLSDRETINYQALGDFQREIGAQNFPFNKEKKEYTIPKLLPGLTAEVVPQNKLSAGSQLIRMPCGLGSVSLLNLDPNAPPFANWEGTPKLWHYLIDELAPPRRHVEKEDELKVINDPYANNPDADVISRLHRELEDFNVPIISFGWVVLFIFLYILIVGPLDYLVLKNVFKRLEWTWITFPAVVLFISILAYFAAYYMKGNDLRVNQVDLIEVDLRTKLKDDFTTEKMSVLGTSWFSILSPQIKSYDIGLEPVPQNWGMTAGKEQPIGDVNLSWLGRPEGSGTASFGRQRSQSLFKKDYLYAEDSGGPEPQFPPAYGLEKVPIPVWTTKTFQASWDLPDLSPEQSPIVADLSYKVGFNQTLSGTLENKLPKGLLDVYLIYQNGAYRLDGTLASKKKVDVQTDFKTPIPMDQWTDQNFNNLDDVVQHTDGYVSTDRIIKSLLFHSKTQSNRSRNVVCGNLDQSWRIKRLNQLNRGVQTAILVARFNRVEGRAEQIENKDPRILTRLWLGALPGKQKTRPELSGRMNRITYVRVYIPVRPKQ